MKTHSKWCGDSLEIQVKKASENQAIDLAEDDVIALIKDDKPLLEALKPQRDNDNIAAQNDEGCSSQAKIEKVRHFLLKNKDIEKHFAPMEISVGPLHASNWFKKELKLKLAKKFITDSGKTPESFLTKIKDNIQELKRSFGKGVICEDSYNDDSLARLLFLDGCAVLQFVYSCVFIDLEKVFKVDSTQAAFIQQDLFLFENQIPFKALTLLMDVLDEGETDKDVRKHPSYFFKVCIIQFVHENNIFANVRNYYVNRSNYCQVDIERLDKIKPAHLLDLLRKVSIFGSIMDVEDEDEDKDEDEDERDDGNEPVSITICDQSKKCLASLDCFRKQESIIRGPLDMETFFQLLEKHERIANRSLRGVQELKSVGIAMKISESRSLKSASFGTHCFGIFGHLKLPALKLNDSTVRKLWNLVAYETCLGEDNKGWYSVTSYLNFLDFLIDTEPDVKKLRTAGVLLNALGSDAEAARLFNTLGLTCLPKYDEDHFEKIHSKIEEHYGGKYKIGVARTYTAYVENPWPTLGLFLTLIALLFTVVQTWYAINPRGS